MFNLTEWFLIFLMAFLASSTYITLKIELIYTQMDSTIIQIMRLVQSNT